MSELREFLDCDLSNLEEGSACLARHEDGIWYPARIKGNSELLIHNKKKKKKTLDSWTPLRRFVLLNPEAALGFVFFNISTQ